MLQASNLHKRYGDVALLHQVSFVVNPGDRIGLIGPNGCGKTTLLRILTGREQPDAGAVSTDPPDLVIGYLEQGLTYAPDATLDDVLREEHHRLEQADAEVARLAGALADAEGEEQARLLDAYAQALTRLERLAQVETTEYQATEMLSNLGLSHLPLSTPIRYLSGGQKTRLGLARLLIRNPQILLLDEPTNHLDIEALEWLETWLQSYAGAAVIVSHDRTFLNRTVTQILELDEVTHEATLYPGNYSDYLKAKQREIERQWETYKAQQDRIAQLKGEIGRLSGYANSIEHGTIDFAPRKIAKGIARRATVQRRRLERELEENRAEKPRLTWHMKLEFVDTPESGQDVLLLEDLAVGYDGEPLLVDVNRTLRAGERVALIGANGTGKTTLLRAIQGQIPPMSGEIRLGANVKVGYYAQEQETLDPNSTPIATIGRVAAMSETDVRSFLHYFLFTGDEVFVRNHSLSYGERARLVLARLVATGCNFLLLDEPINHLDIPSRASFEQAMTAFEGTVLAVVHDRYFIKEFATRVWAVHDRGVHSYVDLESYQRIRKKRL
jgi:ATP-binding cassette subfamily F protein 3